jgi:Sec-independent protein translocase protein TatA
MTDQELREFIADVVKSVVELRSSSAELRESLRDSSAELRKSIEDSNAEFRKSFEDSNAEFRKSLGDSNAEFRKSFEDSNAEFRKSLGDSNAEFRKSLSASDEKLKKLQEENARQINRVNKQIGELGNKFGGFAEGMALPSMEKVLHDEFGMNVVLPRAKSRSNGRTLELDVLAYDHGDRNEAYIVEVKSHLTREGIRQILKTIEEFPKFFPLLGDRKVYGIIASVDIPENLQNEVLKEGLYLARISDDTFKLQVPRNFKPKAFTANGGNGRKKNGAKPKRKRTKK